MTARLVGLLIVALMAQMLWPGAAAARRVIAAERDPSASASLELESNWSLLEDGLLADAADGSWDEHSLFAAAAIAGGVHTDRELDRLATMFATLSMALCTDLPPDQSPSDRAKAVLDFLHRRVLTGGYDLQATEPATVFASGRYNCVSATLFFNCLAREAGLTVHAIKLPQHTRSTIVEGRRRVAVEPTSASWTGDDDSSALAICDVALVAMVYYNRGVEALRRRDHREAIRLNRLALALDPDNTDARGNLLAAINKRALDLAAQHEYASALVLFDAGLAIAPDHIPLRENRALVVRLQHGVALTNSFVSGVESGTTDKLRLSVPHD
jgi:hypothetical protein